VPRVSNSIAIGEARRIACAAQGFGAARPAGAVTAKHITNVFDALGVIQIDSVNVLVRSQELPLFARLGAHKRTAIADATKRGKIFEYWAHEAAHIPVAMQPLFRFKMDAARRGDSSHWGLSSFYTENKSFVEKIYRRIDKDGPLSARELSVRKTPKGSWWDWDESKTALEYLFWTGRLMSRERGGDFARVYDTTERVLPAPVLAMPTPTEHDARSELLLRAAASMGVATAFDLADYFRQKHAVVRPLINELVEAGELHKVSVEGWKEPAYLSQGAKLPRQISAVALLSPFDSLVWCRPRNERLFNFHYRIEIYTPQPKRKFGYYVLPLMINGEIVGRVDLKADRAAKTLRVKGAFVEPAFSRGDSRTEIARHLADELVEMTQWLDLEAVVVERNGNLATQLRSAFKVNNTKRR